MLQCLDEIKRKTTKVKAKLMTEFYQSLFTLNIKTHFPWEKKSVERSDTFRAYPHTQHFHNNTRRQRNICFAWSL